MAAMERRYVTVDVFAAQPFGGNPLAVVLDAEDLTTERMRAITREFHYSETAFVLPPKDPANTAGLRIFTPARELPFAGHPNIGASHVLASRGEVFGKPLTNEIRFEEKAGLVVISVGRDDLGTVTSTELTAPAPFHLGAKADVDEVAASAGLTAGDILTGAHPPVVASVGLEVLITELGSMDALKKAKPLPAPELTRKTSPERYFYVRTGGGGVSARMFAPDIGMPEDPATGAAAAALCGLMGHLSRMDGAAVYQIAQGAEMGRPSLIEGGVDVAGGAVSAVRVKGASVPVMRGVLSV